jgi:predicted nucleic acid-binding protein
VTTLVLDASVVVKWIFSDRHQESHSLHALQILAHIKASRLSIVQPPHWLAEVAAVATRLEPQRARHAIALLYALEFPLVERIEVYEKACDLAAETRQHVFDTLYHAVALVEPGATLVTADERYYQKAMKAGRIVRLRDWTGEGQGVNGEE